ncbi:dentin sialophosphoprotein-like protein [Perilla frutescens var. frutescens]|nr:dentin sialophosphoprotein-like protein [Perilla frutescens var. frutescens]
MLSSVGLEVMNSTNPELNWKSVTKGRRSKKSVARTLNSVVKVGNSTSPKRVGDFSGSDSDKFGEVILGQATSGKSENVPLKKRRHLLQSPSPHLWSSQLRNQDSTPLRPRSSSPHLEDRVQLQYPSCSSGDFSGIELLAAAASMDGDIDDTDVKDLLPEDSSIQKNSDASSSATLSRQGLINNESVNSLSKIDAPGGNVESQENRSAAASQSLSATPEDGTVPKVDRKYWDLNTLMDAWGEPYDDSIAGDTLNDFNESRHMVETDKHFGDHVLSNPTTTTDEPSNLNIEQDKSTPVSEGGIYSEPPHLKENLLEPPNSLYSHTGRDASNLARENNPDDRNSIQALNCDADMKELNPVTSSAAIAGSSPFSKLCCTSDMLMSEEKNNAISGTVAVTQDGDCSSNMSECERTAARDGSHTGTDEVNAHDTAASEPAIDVQLKDVEVSQKTLSTGTFTLDAQPAASTDSNKQIDGASNSTMADCEQYVELAELGSKHDEDNNLPNEVSNRNIMEDTCKSLNAGAQCDGSTTLGRIGLVLDGRRGSDVLQDNHADMIDGDDLTGFQEGYDSPYEDGELRGSFLYSWEDNEVENECVDYESDGRNGDGSDAVDYLGSEIVEGGSEGSHATGRSLSLKLSAEGKSKSGPVKHPLKKHAVKDESDNNEIAGKGSNAGSGSTVEQCVEMAMEENGGMKRLQLLDHKDAVNVRVTHIDEYSSKTVKGKLQSRIEGRSSADATDGKDVFFIQQSRPRRVAGSYPRPERDISPDRYMGRYRSAAPGEREGVHQWTSWGSRRRYTTNYQGGEGRNHPRPRSKTGESANKIDGVDYHEQRQTNYLSKGLHRPLMRRSPVERDDYFGVGRRIPLTRGVGNYRSRGHYSQRPGRDFVEDFEPLPDDGGAPVCMPRYMSRREHSFSPSSGRQAHMSMPRRRSRSRSRTRSPPRAWHPHRERILGARRLSRSPDFRSEGRMERMRLPFSKPTFASADYGEGGYISPSRGRFSPQRNCRWVDDRNFADNPIRRRRSPPVRVFRRTQRFDAVGSSGRLKSDEYFRPVIRPGRFSFMGNSGGGRECKLESNYDDRRRDDSGEMSHPHHQHQQQHQHHRVVHPDDGGNMRRFRHNTGGGGGDDFETNNLNNEDNMKVRLKRRAGGAGISEEEK